MKRLNREQRTELVLRIKSLQTNDSSLKDIGDIVGLSKANVWCYLNYKLKPLKIKKEKIIVVKNKKINPMPLYFKKNECASCKSIFSWTSRKIPYCFECLPQNAGGRDRKRFLVRARDNFTCQECGLVRRPTECKNGKKNLDVHHLNGLCGKLSVACKNEVDISQMITVCHKCHYNRFDHSHKNLLTNTNNIVCNSI
jgi:hypothetical protein